MEADASGAVMAAFDRRPYGKISLGNTKDGPGYTGHVDDSDTNLIYMQARYYDPLVGSFLSVDPSKNMEGDVFSFNKFSYANNSPVGNTDPTGKNVVFSVDKNGAGGNGHTTLYYQDQGGQWYSYNQGDAGTAQNGSSGGSLGFVMGKSTPAHVEITSVDSSQVPTNSSTSIVIETTPEQDGMIAASATSSENAYNSGGIKYNIYTNSCTVAAVDVVNNSNSGVTVANPTFTIRPNSWIKKIVNNPSSIKNNNKKNDSTNNNDDSSSRTPPPPPPQPPPSTEDDAKAGQ